MQISSKQLQKLKYIILKYLYNAGNYQYSIFTLTGAINGLLLDYDDNDYTLALNELKSAGYVSFENLDLHSHNCKITITENGINEYKTYADIGQNYKHPNWHYFKTNILPILDLILSSIAIVISIIALNK